MLKLEVSARALIVALVAIVGFMMLSRLWPVVLLFVVSLMFAAALLPFVEYQVRRNTPRGLAVLFVILAMLLMVVVLGLIVAPVVIEQGRAIGERLPELRESTARFLERRGGEDLARQVREYNPSSRLDTSLITNAGRTLLAALTTAVTILALTAYIMFDARRLQSFLYFSTPVRYHHHIEELMGSLQRVVGGYVRGQLLTSACITVFTFVVLTILRVPNPLAFAVLAGIADMIPMVGIIFCVGPATLAALGVSTPTAVIVAGLLVAYQEFENRILVQKIYGSTLQLPAIVVLISLLVGAELLGVAGALLSLPAAAAIRVVLMYAYDVRRGQKPAVLDENHVFAPDLPANSKEPVAVGPN